MEQLQILYETKYKIQDELSEINKQIDELKYELQKNCSHINLNKYRYFDGHTWSNEYSCDVCQKAIYNVDITTQNINTKY
jgi:hypothetical protein